MEPELTQKTQDPALPSGGRMILVMGLVGLLASFLLVATYVVTTPYIEANLAEYLEQAISEVLPNTVTKTTFILDSNGLQPELDPTDAGNRVYAGYDADGKFTGVAISAQGQGYQDIIRVLYGYSPDCSCIIGMKVLESRETPGLGDKIEKDPAFLSNFDALDVRWSATENSLVGSLELIKRGAKTAAWEIHGISGATISSKAITDLLNASNQLVIPLIERNKDLFTVEPNE